MLQEGCTLRDLVKEMLHDCEEWCSKKMICKVWVESHSWSGIEMNSTNQGVMMRRSQCSEKVNTMACCCVGQNVVFFFEKRGTA